MKLGNVTQWVRDTGASQFPPAQSLAGRAVANPTCIAGNGGFGAGASKNAGRVTEPRNLYTRGLKGYPSKGRKPTIWSGRKAAVSGALWQASATPPGSVITGRACIHRGNSGTWEVQHLPSSKCRVMEVRLNKPPRPGEAWDMPSPGVRKETLKKISCRGTSAQAEA